MASWSPCLPSNPPGFLERRTEGEETRHTQDLILSILLLVAFSVPLFVTSRYIYHLLIMSTIWGIAATAMNLIMGFTGQVNLAHGAFFGIGAYTTGLLMLKLGVNFWPALLAACIVAAIFGFLIGLPSLRTKGSYFAIGTLCFNVIVTVIIDRWDTLTEGQRGLMGIEGPAPIPLPFGYRITFESMTATYYLNLVLLLFTLFVVYRIVHSLSGRTFPGGARQRRALFVPGHQSLQDQVDLFCHQHVFRGTCRRALCILYRVPQP